MEFFVVHCVHSPLYVQPSSSCPAEPLRAESPESRLLTCVWLVFWTRTALRRCVHQQNIHPFEILDSEISNLKTELQTLLNIWKIFNHHEFSEVISACELNIILKGWKWRKISVACLTAKVDTILLEERIRIWE